MRIERHQVREGLLHAATDDFAGRIAGAVHRQHEAGSNAAFGWRTVGTDLLKYANARSAANPAIDLDTWTALLSAAEAYLGALCLSVAPAGTSMDVMITYTGTGVSYYDGVPTAKGSLYAFRWLDALYLWIVVGRQDQQRDAFLGIARHLPEDEGLAHALADHVFRDGDHVAEHLESTAGNTASALRALVRGNRQDFWDTIADMLTEHRSGLLDDPDPSTLLPLEPLALTALAVREKGWEQRIESDYLPHRLTAGETGQERPRVGFYGTDKKTLVPGRTFTVEWPRRNANIESLRLMDKFAAEHLQEIRRPEIARNMAPGSLIMKAKSELERFAARSTFDPRGTDPRQIEALELASQYSEAAFRVAFAPGDTVEVTIGDVTVPLPCLGPAYGVTSWNWRLAVALAIISGSQERLSRLLDVPLNALKDENAPPLHARYAAALHAVLRGDEARPAGDRAIDAYIKEADDWVRPPVPLLSQIVAGDRDGFALALVDALEERRDHYSIGDRLDEIDIDVLALACLVQGRLGWDVPVISDHLPAEIIGAAAPV